MYGTLSSAIHTSSVSNFTGRDMNQGSKCQDLIPLDPSREMIETYNYVQFNSIIVEYNLLCSFN